MRCDASIDTESNRFTGHIHAVSAYKKRLYKKRLVEGLIVKKRTLDDFYQAKKRVSYLHSQNLLS